MIFRLRDVVRFRRGSNEYTGEVVKRFSAVKAVRVRVESGEWMVATKDIVRVEVPVLTVPERHAILVLAGGRTTIAETHAVGTPIASKTISDLCGRGFVEGTVESIGGRRCLWSLTAEGRRIQHLPYDPPRAV